MQDFLRKLALNVEDFLVGLVVKASTSKSWVQFLLALFRFMWVESYQWLRNFQWLRHPPQKGVFNSCLHCLDLCGLSHTSDLEIGTLVDLSGLSHTSDLEIGTPVATLPGTWRYRVSTCTDWPGVSLLWQDEVENLIYNFYLRVAACKLVWADPSPRYTSMMLGLVQPTNNNNHVSVSVQGSMVVL